jgi:sigma-B regulation protein RsbU (phosphoserine phosphatase)
MPRRRDAASSSPAARRPWSTRLRPRRAAARIALITALLVIVSIARYLLNDPSLAIALYALVPILLAVYWFELVGGLVAAAVATGLFVADEIVFPSPQLSSQLLAVAAANRAIVFFGIAVLVAAMLQRQRHLTIRLREQQEQLTELEGIRSALTPSEVPDRPRLQIATSFTPAVGQVAGDFFLVVEGPAGSTTVVVGDVVGHGLAAARCAAFVRAALATFARFSADPVLLLQLANAALAENRLADARFVTAACLNIADDRQVVWASAGHDVPWCLDSADPLPVGRVGAPLGTGPAALQITAGRMVLQPGTGVLLFTDGLTEARGRREPGRPRELFGEDRARQIVRKQAGAAVDQVLDALTSAVTAFSGGPLADDLCLVAIRATAR